jgi:FtsP/CotA-like multicopper oxidase with cupredoxin domain
MNIERTKSAALSRRRLLLTAGAAILAGLAVPRSGPAAISGPEYRLTAGAGRALLLGDGKPATDVWCYQNQVPGPDIRIRQGDRLRVRVENRLPRPTTVHWHGIRLPNAMDGVPHLTQEPIAPGESFLYEFDVPDAGTFWYHSHLRDTEQIGRGLYGPLIVEEQQPIAVDRDVVWMLSDWRLEPDGKISDDFDDYHDIAHDGRVGNIVTVNGRVPESFAARAGERIRLRLINGANARIFSLAFEGHRPWIIALDGQPVEPHEPAGGRVLLGPGMRADLVIDMLGTPGRRFAVKDTFYEGLEYRLLDLVYRDEPPVNAHPPENPIMLPANPVSRPDLDHAVSYELRLGGGMMGGMTHALVQGREESMDAMARDHLAWAINGIAGFGYRHAPLFTLARDRAYILRLVNDTRWHHPIHLHGLAFRVLSRDNNPARYEEWGDTVLLRPRERVDLAFVADNPGDWMIHCHILEHQLGGMMAVLRIA